MSEYDPYAMGLPTGRRVDQSGDRLPEGVLGNVSQFPRATQERLDVVRKNLPEVPDERLDRSVNPWVDRETGAAYELVRSYLNIIDPAASGTTAFVVSDGWIVPLRPAGFEEVPTSVHVGNLTHDGSRP